MACVLVPATEAIVTTIATKVIEKKEAKNEEISLKEGVSISELHKEKLSTKMKRLNALLWGGSVLLIFEHVWHGEIVPFFPFLTAAQNAEDTAEMIHEMSTVGVGMAVAITGTWIITNVVLKAIDTRASKVKAADRA